MYAIVVWMDETTPVPSVIGPYEEDSVFTTADFLRERLYKVQVCNITAPENCNALTGLVVN